jgi:hypothetical protein
MLIGHKYKWSSVAIAAAALIAGCGGGSDTQGLDAAPQAALSATPQAAVLLPGTSVTPEEAARQLMDYAETTFPSLFPGHPTTGSLPPFSYRAYPGGIYLGVVVAEGTPYAYGHVYVVGILGGTLAAPRDVGALTSFITPVVSGGGGGAGSSNGCFDLSLAETQGTHSVIGYTYSGAITGTEIVDSTVGAMTTFEGQSARQSALITTGSHTAAGQTVAINTNGTTYSARTGDGQMTQYGLQTVASGSAGGITFTTTIKTVYSPPFVDNQYSLALGSSITQTLAGTATTTIHTGVVPDQVTTSAIPASTSTTTYVGQEQVSVIAGTYSACKYQVTTPGSSDVTTSWFIVGKGIPVKTTISGSVSQTIEANSVVLNGAHL